MFVQWELIRVSNPSRWLALIDDCDFATLFVDELGWNQPISEPIFVESGLEKFTIKPISSFKGIQVWACDSVPNAKVQREIDKEISKVSAERLIIFHNNEFQNWRWPMSRESSGKGIVRLVNHEHFKGQQTQSLLQRLNFIAIDISSEEPSLIEMLLRLRKAFDADQVTKKFYKDYSSRQKNLLSQISGLENNKDKEWYSSLLLNRIMFIYFMQWKGFMDGDQNYLFNRLNKIKTLKGPNHFYGFFKDFLLPLFHKGLGAGEKITLPKEISQLVGEIPYVNGGIFSEHLLEEANQIDIPDSAFEEIFTFFDQYQWHLDSRRTGKENEINPDVLGYVFEQFVNNKEKGAYYTKEDITDYMTSNVLIIKLLEEIEKNCRINLLKPLVSNPDRYIWPSIKFGEKVNQVNKVPSEDSRLPNESSYETEARIKYLKDLRSIIGNGKLENLSDLISLNVDLELLAIDVLDGLDTPEDVVQIWKILTGTKIVDPTCGSGAFLFAALNQLEHLYSILLDVADLHAKTSKNQELQQLLSDVKRHPNRKYFVLKHAAQNNLYGVDIMREAAEIARLRLFLKLISAIEKYEDIEPLPDLEFNIKTGNLLIGITKSDAIQNYMTTLDSLTFIEDINNQVTHLADLWENFLLSQEMGHVSALKAKKILQNGTSILRSTLDKLFYEGINTNRTKQTFQDWKDESIPFHWFIEFPDVFEKGGFDVIIGNPPYIQKSKVGYSLEGHFTSSCPDIYAMCMERASLISNKDATFTMIVMASLMFSDGYTKLREFLSNQFPKRWVCSFGTRPSLLFEGVEVRNTIFIGTQGRKSLHTAPMMRWVKDYRPHLMSTIKYIEVDSSIDSNESWPFITSKKIFEILSQKNGSIANDVLARGPEYKLDTNGRPKWDETLGSMAPLFYFGTARNFISAFKTVPPSVDGDGNPVISSSLKFVWLKNSTSRDILLTLMVSKWMFVWWAIWGDDFHVTKDNVISFPIDISRISKENSEKLSVLATNLDTELQNHIKYQKITFPDKRVIKVGNYDFSAVTEIINEIDEIWTVILSAQEFRWDLMFQYYSTVKVGNEVDIE